MVNITTQYFAYFKMI